MPKGSILIVDDDEFFRELHADILRDDGYNVMVASTGREAIGLVRSNPIDIVVTDLVMPDLSGQDVLERTKQHNALIEVVLVTSHGTIDSAIDALKGGAFDYIKKPVNKDELVLSIKRCYEQKLLVQETRCLKQSLKLFKVSRTIASCLEIDKLYRLTLDALLQEIPGEAGICLFLCKDRKSLEVKATKDFETKNAKIIADLVTKKYEENADFFDRLLVLNIDDFQFDNIKALNGFTSMIVAPLKRGDETTGFLLTLSKLPKYEFSDEDIENACFIAEQSSLSFENAEKYASAKALAYVDSLTDLYNPKFLDIAIDREIRRSSRSEIPFTVLFMDLDYFKNVNDSHGHLVGSKVLIEVSHLLLKCVREVDTVIRYGGDEYTIVLVDSNHDTAFHVAERIRATIESHSFLEDENLSLKVTASIGLATYPTHATTKRDLLDLADQAMYYGKNRSRNTVYIANNEETNK